MRDSLVIQLLHMERGSSGKRKSKLQLWLPAASRWAHFFGVHTLHVELAERKKKHFPVERTSESVGLCHQCIWLFRGNMVTPIWRVSRCLIKGRFHLAYTSGCIQLGNPDLMGIVERDHRSISNIWASREQKQKKKSR
jgi:hypothetical protein